jgi:dTDP-4-dehydrorhamnose reductase
MSSPSGHQILLTGGSGQVGTEIIRLASAGLEIVAPGRTQLDVSDPEAISRLIASQPWVAVINCAAYTAVDKAESDVVAAWRANALGPAAIAQATAQAQIPLIHVSTDYVFDGSKAGFYLETDPVAPIGVYGASKEGGEQAIRTANPRHVILRTAWVVSPHGSNFVKTMLRLGQTRPELKVVDDQRGCPTSATDIAETVLTIVGRMIAKEDAPTGTYHFVNSGEASWYEFARSIFQMVSERGVPVPAVHPIPSFEYPTPARRPVNSRLDTTKLNRDYGVVPRPWPEAVAEIVATLADQAQRQEP